VPERDHQLQTIVTLLSHFAGPATILELCCGTGLLAETLLDALPTITVYGLDGSDEMLQRAGERLARFGGLFRCSAFEWLRWQRMSLPSTWIA
jgi:ubiquinone/menaquinone biosynthesis C-methylase UbiE